MISQPTVLILGAGASYELGMPLGPELARLVGAAIDVHNANPFLIEIRKIPDHEKLLDAAGDLRASIRAQPSIDEALHWISDNEFAVKLGKLAIVQEIIAAERRSHLFSPDGAANLGGNTDTTWLPVFFSMLIAGLRRDRPDEITKNLTIINFNYDRVFDLYLYWALQRLGTLNKGVARSIVENLNVIRPYGHIGHLFDPVDPVPFGAKSCNLDQVSRKIRTFTEQEHSETKQKIVNAISTCRAIIVLGFGFHGQNMEMLKCGSAKEPRSVFATTKGMDSRNTLVRHQQIVSTFRLDGSREPVTPDKTARELLVDLWPSIMAAVN